MINLKSAREIETMSASCRLAAETLDYLGEQLRPGITTEEVDQLAYEFITKRGATPSPLNYHGFPKSICTSRNNVICHGIPNSQEKLQSGDILNIDVTTHFKGFHGDTNRTFLIGDVSSHAKKLVETTYECLIAGIGEVAPGKRLGDIGAAIEECANTHGFSVVRDFCGHGIGREFHEEPQILHYGKRGTGLKLKEGMTFTIEPMINEGSYHAEVQADGWTALTRDGKLSAQFEHTMALTANGVKVLTYWPGGQEPRLAELGLI